MTIQYDKLNQAKQLLRTLRQEFIDGIITKDELDAQELKVRADIRAILGL